ncbi:hypothetical protein BDP27DRAFT_1377920 [Rhodocollybia butyracea]|uniref:Glycan binding protein Y3-like domain-containing protein n=1 Tax=Rhodocollybia butyracea TaxID=206335 RepID=A0A9P5P033_9AGAR|nr:hypothetical protein BDP27DRAFT_1377920 [Rhodocollybia butyracea]
MAAKAPPWYYLLLQLQLLLLSSITLPAKWHSFMRLVPAMRLAQWPTLTSTYWRGIGDFTTWNEFGTGNLPAPDGCESVLDLISENCPMGGQGTAGGFASFQMIPNEGSCNFNG